MPEEQQNTPLPTQPIPVDFNPRSFFLIDDERTQKLIDELQTLLARTRSISEAFSQVMIDPSYTYKEKEFMYYIGGILTAKVLAERLSQSHESQDSEDGEQEQ